MRRTRARGSFAIFLGFLGITLSAAAVSHAAPLPPRSASDTKPPPTSPGVEIIQHGGYPELRVDGQPYFVHGAVFFYFRVPRDLWEDSLDAYRDLGINTIDLPVPWNWHEPREGELDFDGHTNPRRDLRGLLKLIAERNFKLIVRPGPIIGSHWRHAGYPDWLLARPQVRMGAAARLAGDPPPLADLMRRDAEAAAAGWLDNAAHMPAAQRWLAAVAKEIAPYSARRKLRVTQPTGKAGAPEEKEISGPLLFVQLDDRPAFDPRSPASAPGGESKYWRYIAELRRALEGAGVDAIFTVNPTNLGDSGPPRAILSSSAAAERPIGLTAQWFLPPSSPAQGEIPPGGQQFTAQNAATLAFLAGTLAAQPSFPAIFTDYQAGWLAPADDDRPRESSPANTLLSSRLLLARGVHGLNYSPLQDTLSPAGYFTFEANRYDRWDAALDLSGNRHPRAVSVARNGQALELWGAFLAASHPRADFGLIDLRGALEDASVPRKRPRRADLSKISETIMQIERVAQLAGLQDELVDPQTQPVEQLLRHAVLLLPLSDPAQEKFQLSEKAQENLAEYLRRGGTLISVPPLFSAAWGDSLRRFGKGGASGFGRLVEWGKDFYSWVVLSESLKQSRVRLEATWATQALRDTLEQNGVRPAIRRATNGSRKDNLEITQLVANEGTDALGARRANCAKAPLCGTGLLSATNISFDEPAEETVEILSPGAGMRGDPADYLPLHLQLPAHESLLLPLHFSLCPEAGNERCDDEVVVAAAELVRVEREGKTLELSFYTPARATVLLKLESVPSKIEMQDFTLEGKWTPEKQQLEVTIPRGASPGFIRVLKLHLHYTPRVLVKPKSRPRFRRDLDAAVMDPVRLPLGDDASLPSYPPLVLLDSNHKGHLLFGAENYDENARDVSFEIRGAERGSDRMTVGADELRLDRVNLVPEKNSRPGEQDPGASSDGLLRGALDAHSGHIDRKIPLRFAVVDENTSARYQFDFDRDGAAEWVLENDRLRLILSPADGGRALALVDKSSGTNLTTTVGAMRDLFVPLTSPGGEPPKELDATFNLAYTAEWASAQKTSPGSAPANALDAPPAVRLSVVVPDAGGTRRYPSGARIEKTVRLAGKDTLEVDYRVALPGVQVAQDSFLVENTDRIPSAGLAFMAMNSVPAREAGELTTRFCWDDSPAAAPGPPQHEKSETKSAAAHCEAFVAGGRALTLPEAVRRLEMHTTGRPGLTLDWQSGRMTIEMKHFSALLKLQFPAPPNLPTPTEPASNQLRYTVLAPE